MPLSITRSPQKCNRFSNIFQKIYKHLFNGIDIIGTVYEIEQTWQQTPSLFYSLIGKILNKTVPQIPPCQSSPSPTEDLRRRAAPVHAS